MSRLMGKPTICICENKGADQLRGNREADQRLCFRYTDSTFPLLSKSKISGRFVSDLFGNHIVGFPTRSLKCYHFLWVPFRTASDSAKIVRKTYPCNEYSLKPHLYKVMIQNIDCGYSQSMCTHNQCFEQKN